MAYKVGDLVQLKSSGPVMTVTELPDRLTGTYGTTWFAGAKMEHGRFPENALKAAKEDEKK